MPYATIVVLGWAQPDFETASKALEIRLPLTDKDWKGVGSEGADDWIHKRGVQPFLMDRLHAAHKDLLAQTGCQFLKMGDGYHPNPIYQTPWGEREVDLFNSALYYDPSEMRDKREDAVFGVALSYRYQPVFLDLADEHGGLDRIVLNEETLRKILWTKKVITTHIPGFHTADPIILERHF